MTLKQKALIALILTTLLTGCEQAQHTSEQSGTKQVDGQDHAEQQATKAFDLASSNLVVHKSPTCGCCTEWVNHVNTAGYKTNVVEDSDLSAIKERFGIVARARSCHTAIYNDQYVFEGHVPPSVMRQFLESPPANAKGLVVPGMPIGSPGMEDGDRFQPYKVWLLSDNGEFTEYADIQNYASQF